jgi:hypothetical protein
VHNGEAVVGQQVATHADEANPQIFEKLLTNFVADSLLRVSVNSAIDLDRDLEFLAVESQGPRRRPGVDGET